MANTFARHWPKEVDLTVYAEGFDPDIYEAWADLDESAPWLAPWKAQRTKAQRGMVDGRYSYKQDAVRFSHKVAAIGAAAVETDVDVLIWIDADTITHSPVTVGWLDELFPTPATIAWLDRERKYPECGFLMFRIPAARLVIGEIVAAYQTGAIFRYPETHDSYVIQQIVEAAVKRGEIEVASLSGEGRKSAHPFVNSRLAEKLDHLKGGRKEHGRSHRSDLIGARSEAYWQ